MPDSLGDVQSERSPDDLSKCCYYCDLPIKKGERAIQSQAGNAWAHVTCWYDGGPFEREMREKGFGD